MSTKLTIKKLSYHHIILQVERAEINAQEESTLLTTRIQRGQNQSSPSRRG